MRFLFFNVLMILVSICSPCLALADPPHFTWRFVTQGPNDPIPYRGATITIFRNGFLTNVQGQPPDMLQHVAHPGRFSQDPFISTTTNMNWILEEFVRQRVGNWRTLQQGARVGYVYQVRNFQGSNNMGSWDVIASLQAVQTRAEYIGNREHAQEARFVLNNYGGEEDEWAFWGPIPTAYIRSAQEVIFNGILDPGTPRERPSFVLGAQTVENPAYQEDESSRGHSGPFPPYVPPEPSSSDDDDDYSLVRSTPYMSASFCGPYSSMSFRFASLNANADDHDACSVRPYRVRHWSKGQFALPAVIPLLLN